MRAKVLPKLDHKQLPMRDFVDYGDTDFAAVPGAARARASKKAPHGHLLTIPPGRIGLGPNRPCPAVMEPVRTPRCPLTPDPSSVQVQRRFDAMTNIGPIARPAVAQKAPAQITQLTQRPRCATIALERAPSSPYLPYGFRPTSSPSPAEDSGKGPQPGRQNRLTFRDVTVLCGPPCQQGGRGE